MREAIAVRAFYSKTSRSQAHRFRRAQLHVTTGRRARNTRRSRIAKNSVVRLRPICRTGR